MPKAQRHDESSFTVLAEIIEKMMDAQIHNATDLNQIKNVNADICDAVTEIQNQFRNGFRSELKNHITTEINQHQEDMMDIHVSCKEDMVKSARETQAKIGDLCDKVGILLEKINDLGAFLKKPSLWIKLVVALIISLGSIAAGLLTLDKVIESNAISHMVHEQIVDQLQKQTNSVQNIPKE